MDCVATKNKRQMVFSYDNSITVSKVNIITMRQPHMSMAHVQL